MKSGILIFHCLNVDNKASHANEVMFFHIQKSQII